MEQMAVMITGGAGYIGSVTNAFLREKGVDTIIFDNMSRGHKDFLHGSKLMEGDLICKNDIEKAFSGNDIEYVMHLAGLAYVGESMEDPHKYFANNLIGTLNLLETMKKFDVKNIVFSSSCSVYGSPETLPVTENTPLKPESVYAETKSMAEKFLQWHEKIHGFNVTILRYFNASGASKKFGIGEWHIPETHMIPCAINAAIKGTLMEIFGNDYPTKDGTCVRDYIHVEDIAQAHFLALKKTGIYNLGYGKGISNNEIIKTVEEITGKKVKVMYSGRRNGDPPEIYADNKKAKNILEWKPTHDITSIISTSYEWAIKNPKVIT